MFCNLVWINSSFHKKTSDAFIDDNLFFYILKITCYQLIQAFSMTETYFSFAAWNLDTSWTAGLRGRAKIHARDWRQRSRSTVFVIQPHSWHGSARRQRQSSCLWEAVLFHQHSGISSGKLSIFPGHCYRQGYWKQCSSHLHHQRTGVPKHIRCLPKLWVALSERGEIRLHWIASKNCNEIWILCV